MAMYTIFETPLQMLSDAPHKYRRNQECTDFISAIPVVWDDTKVLEGKCGEYVAIARRTGDNWYVAAINGWKEADKTLDLSFLGDGKWKMEIMQDGVNADRNATDYKKTEANLPAGGKYGIHLAPGGGFAARITPVR